MADGYLILVIGATLGGLVQGLSGSNFGMTSTAVWAWFLAPQVVAPLALTGSLTGQILGALTLRRGWHWRRFAPFLIGGLLGIPLGVLLLPRLDTDLFKLVLGSLLVLTCPALLLASELPRIRRGGRLADGLAGLGGGILGGLGGYTGVIPTLWTTLRGLPKDEQRAIIQNFNLGIQLVTFSAYLWQGLITRALLPQLALLIPVVLLTSWFGTRIYLGLSEVRFRQLVLLLLTAAGVAMLAAALPRLLA
ncbi:MAG: sulfite exporter TauE/SafE family protein [Burkholderiaceae bacterium]|nr:sulfite exporter TauE/SafE family protein [Burkholderiaceae bacterium]